jgi:methylated-DNA-[protein]-cysteine S-methyltransferase
MTYVATLAAPGGPLTVAVTADGVVHRSLYGPVERVLEALPGALPVDPDDLPGGVADAVARYASGDVGALDAVLVQQTGGQFAQSVWAVMRDIPPGSTVSYAELARRAGRPTAVRAAASACARNLVAPFVPCHRVVRSDGSLGGYAYGLEVKRALLDHELANASLDGG